MTEQQKLAVVMLNDGYKVKSVAEKLDVPMVILRKWLSEPWFTRERYLDMSMRFSELVPQALCTLQEVMINPDSRGADKIKAAVEILDRAGFVVQKDIRIMGDVNVKHTALPLSPEEYRETLRKVDEVLAMKDITPEEQLQIENEIFTEELIEECEGKHEQDD